MKHRSWLFLGFLLAGVHLAGAEEAKPTGPPSKRVMMTALQWMQSSDPARRDAAYRSVHLLGKEALPAFETALRKALIFHEKRLADTLSGRNSKGNPYSELIEVADELGTERERVYKLILTDYKKDPGKIRMLRTEFEGIERLYQQAAKLAAADTESIDRQIDAITAALVEIHEQLARFEGETNEEAAETTTAERRQEALEGSFDGHSYLQAAKHLGAMRSEVARLAGANEKNAAMSWANSAQKDFTKHLNYERAVMGLGPLLLEEKLSEAATGHSQDMKALGFFSHTSPVEGKRSPGDRARKAGFKGGWSGENIFMGSGSPLAAYNGWFGSDGHRFIMFAKGPNVAGVGPVGGHWTLMTGRVR